MTTATEAGGADTRGAERRGIQSIEVGGTLLQALARQGNPMMLKDLAAKAGMPAAKAHPYLVSFVKLGLVEQDALTGRYRLGPFALQLGLVALRGLDPVRIAIQEAALLADEIQASIALAVWGNFGPTVVHIEEGPRPIHVNMRPGTVMMPLLLSATGRVFAAFMPARIIEPMLQREIEAPGAAEGARPSLPALAHARHADQGPASATGQDRSSVSRAQADAWLQEIRERQLARAIGNPIPGIHAFSAPVHDASGQLALAITAIGTDEDFAPDWDSPVAERLHSCARQIEYRLGCPPPSALALGLQAAQGTTPDRESANDRRSSAD